ncbi:MAG TPA: LamG domain-containing protein [Candidatus Omnitrophota bacterium]|nr:LamG domain-containing protein [Candidatus Omnitrophota bacterium]MDD5270930.1 LamG domain-containing protein [Candidatus Omnitrophota bacterium]HPN66277.1 LamG domain-containing protein [Candidatus Omnitrophota bacterium]
MNIRIFAVMLALSFPCAGCAILPKKAPVTGRQYDIDAINDASGMYSAAKPQAKPQAQPQPELPEKELALRYSFGGVSRDGKIPDESGNGHSGTVFGATPANDPEMGKVYYFNGVDNYILAGDLGYFPSGTISFWMKAEEVRNYRNPFSTNYAAWDDCIRFEEYSDEKFVVGALGLGTGFFTYSLKPMRWYHVAYAWDDKAGYGYLDGKQIFIANHPDPDTSVHPNIGNNAGYWKERSLNLRNVAIGNGYSASPDRYWKGWIGDVRIYNRALTAKEIESVSTRKEK